MLFYAHTLKDQPKEKWEPLFTPFDEAEDVCQRDNCDKCKNLEPYHGHLNKVAFWTAKFVAEMFPKDSDESESAHQWGYLTGIWHDLGKFAPAWQIYLSSKADPHAGEVSGKVDHSTAGAQQAVKIQILGHLLAYPIAGHHSGLLDAVSNHACQKTRLAKSDLADWSGAPEEIISAPLPALPSFLQRDSFSLAFFSLMPISSPPSRS
jgi:CRISPR-associated endonuclease/helicase Cas3